MSRSSRDARDRVNGGHLDALRALKLEKRRPTDADRPRPSTFPGRNAERIPGQLRIGQSGESEAA
jgi:hypothetical protein